MCFIDKRKMNWIRKDDRIPDPIRPPSRVGYGGTGCHNNYILVLFDNLLFSDYDETVDRLCEMIDRLIA